jgi:hypothetical protein
MYIIYIIYIYIYLNIYDIDYIYIYIYAWGVPYSPAVADDVSWGCSDCHECLERGGGGGGRERARARMTVMSAHI